MTGRDDEPDDPLYAPVAHVAAGLDPGDVSDPDQLDMDLLDGLDDPDAAGMVDEGYDPDAVRDRRKTRRSRRPRSESALARDLVNYLNGLPGWWARKIQATAATGPGIPDIHATGLTTFGVGRAVWVEVKVGAERPTAVQNRTMLLLQAAGALVGYATSVTELEEIIAHLDDPDYRWSPEHGPGAPSAS